MSIHFQPTCLKRTTVAGVLLIFLSPTLSYAGPITGNYWFMGVGNDQAAEENETLLEILSQREPWNMLPAGRKALLDNKGGKDILQQLRYFHDNVKNGDTFLFYYGGHATSLVPDADADDPGEDEGIGLPDDVASDDELASDPYFGSFAESSTVIVLMNTCFAGGFVGGTNDLDRAAIKAKTNLLFVGIVPEGQCVGPERRFFLPLVSQALTEGDANGDKQVHWGEWAAKLQTLWEDRTGNRLVTSNNLDAEHDRTTGNPVPEPSSVIVILVSIGTLGLFGIRARRS